jgi:hypothetical protein
MAAATNAPPDVDLCLYVLSYVFDSQARFQSHLFTVGRHRQVSIILPTIVAPQAVFNTTLSCFPMASVVAAGNVVPLSTVPQGIHLLYHRVAPIDDISTRFAPCAFTVWNAQAGLPLPPIPNEFELVSVVLPTYEWQDFLIDTFVPQGLEIRLSLDGSGLRQMRIPPTWRLQWNLGPEHPLFRMEVTRSTTIAEIRQAIANHTKFPYTRVHIEAPADKILQGTHSAATIQPPPPAPATNTVPLVEAGARSAVTQPPTVPLHDADTSEACELFALQHHVSVRLLPASS